MATRDDSLMWPMAIFVAVIIGMILTYWWGVTSMTLSAEAYDHAKRESVTVELLDKLGFFKTKGTTVEPTHVLGHRICSWLIGVSYLVIAGLIADRKSNV